jgi:hypothetical protein
LDEAFLRLSHQGAINALHDRLIEQVDGFAGLWIDHEPTYRVVIATVDDIAFQTVDESVKTVLSEYPSIAPYASCVKAKHTYRDLFKTYSSLTDMLIDGKEKFATSLDIKGNLVSLRLESERSLESVVDPALSRHGQDALPARSAISFADRQKGLEGRLKWDVRGGRQITTTLTAAGDIGGCTTNFAFGFYGGVGTQSRRIGTAGHCPTGNPGWVASTAAGVWASTIYKGRAAGYVGTGYHDFQ